MSDYKLTVKLVDPQIFTQLALALNQNLVVDLLDDPIREFLTVLSTAEMKERAAVVGEVLRFGHWESLEESQILSELSGLCMGEVGEVGGCLVDNKISKHASDFFIFVLQQSPLDYSHNCAKSVKVDAGGRLGEQLPQELLGILDVFGAVEVQELLETAQGRGRRVVDREELHHFLLV
jgi:hypothetical protein